MLALSIWEPVFDFHLVFVTMFHFDLVSVTVTASVVLAVRVLGYRSGGLGSIPGTTKKK
jgi:hypothetical protein